MKHTLIKSRKLKPPVLQRRFNNTMTTFLKVCCCLFIGFFIGLSNLQAQTWEGDTDTDYNNPNNWAGDALPAGHPDNFTGQTLTIMSGATFAPVIPPDTINVGMLVVDSDLSIPADVAIISTGGTDGVEVDAAATLTIEVGGKLIVEGATTQAVEVLGNLVVNDSLIIHDSGLNAMSVIFGSTVNVGATGVICADSIAANGIDNNGTVDNEGTIYIFNAVGSGIVNNPASVFMNNGNIYIDDVEAEGVFNMGGMFINNNGDSLRISRTGMNGINHIGTIFTSRGIITIDMVTLDGVFASADFDSDGDTILIGTNQPLTGSGASKGSANPQMITGIGGDGFELDANYTISNSALISIGDSTAANVGGAGFNLTNNSRVTVSGAASTTDSSKINIQGVSGDGIDLSTGSIFNSFDGTTICVLNTTGNGVDNKGIFRNENARLKLDNIGETAIINDENPGPESPATLNNLEGGLIEIGLNGGGVTIGIDNGGTINNGSVVTDDTGTAIRINATGTAITQNDGTITNGDGVNNDECVLIETNTPLVVAGGTITNNDIYTTTSTVVNAITAGAFLNNGILVDPTNAFMNDLTARTPGAIFNPASSGVIVAPVDAACFTTEITDFLIAFPAVNIATAPFLPDEIFVDDVSGGQIGTFDASTNTLTLSMAANNMRLRFDIESGGTSCGSQGLAMVSFANINSPVITCNGHVQISLGAECKAVIDPNFIIEGAALACTDGYTVELLGGSRVGQDTLDSSYIGQTVNVRVTGPTGNSCWGSITVEDKLPPALTCRDTFVYCNQQISPDSLGFPIAVDACGGPVTFNYVDMEENLGACGQNSMDQDTLRSIRRLFTAFDQYGNSDTCSQIILVLRPPIDSIRFPDSLTGSNALQCIGNTTVIADPQVTGRPFAVINGDTVIVDALCGYGISMTDIRMNLGCAGKERILRTWTVMDWCHLSTGGSVRTAVQLIDIRDSIPPTFDPFPDTVEVVTTFDSSKVTLLTNNEHKCMANILPPKIKNVSDNCSGSTFRILGPTKTIFNDPNDSLINIPFGTHQLEYIISDSCGNEARDTITFILRDTELPTIIANNNVNIVLNNAISTWVPASVFNAGSTDNCELDSFLLRKTDQDTFALNVSFTCADRLLDSVQVKLIDTTGNANFAWVQVQITDPNGFCTPFAGVEAGTDNDEGNEIDEVDADNGDNETNNTDGTNEVETNEPAPIPTANIAGHIQNENGDMIESVSIAIGGYEMLPAITGANGIFMFEDIPLEGNYRIKPDKDMNYTNGISTYDIVLLSKHVLGLKHLDSPYKMIAADINNSGSITAYDMVLLRQLILGIKDNLANNTSWRFIDAAYEFINPSNPFEEDFPEAYEIQSLSTDMMTLDFVAVKIGDLNESAVANQLMIAESRNTNESLNFTIKEQHKQAGETVTIPIKANNFKDILGYQFTLDFDANALAFETILIGENMGFENFNLSMVHRGMITSSWSQAEATTIPSEKALFSLVFKVKKQVPLSEAIHLGSTITKAEAYNADEEILNVNLDIKYAGANIAGFKLYQNKPNPFTGETIIGFDLPTASAVTLTILDMSGKTVKEIKGDFEAGYNQLSIDGKAFNEHGMFYYRLATKNGIETKKMILLKR